jgi:hypothetical protein
MRLLRFCQLLPKNGKAEANFIAFSYLIGVNITESQKITPHPLHTSLILCSSVLVHLTSVKSILAPLMRALMVVQ